MAKTIGNPLSWTAQHLGLAAGHVADTTERIGGTDTTPITEDQINTLTMDDLRAALRAGVDDLGAARADVMFLAVIYPVIGLLLAGFGLHLSLLPLLFPLIAGFALLGPVAAVGLYEISRRREQGQPANWSHAFGVTAAPSFGAIVVLGLYLLAIFVAWMLVARGIYALTLGPDTPASIASFLTELLTTGAGWALLIFGIGVGCGFALLVLATSVVSFPLLLDRDVGVPNAIITSVRVTMKNPRVICAWGLIVAGGLVLGSIPALIGLVIVMPVLGHATWHLYRRAIKS